MSKLDSEILGRIAGDYTKLVKGVLDSEDRDRFSLAIKICERARNLLALESPRVGDFDRQIDENNEIAMRGGGIINGVPFGGGYGDNGEIMRHMVEIAREALERKRNPAGELNDIIMARDALRASGETTDDLDGRIRALRAEIAGVGSLVVVGDNALAGAGAGAGLLEGGTP